VADRLDGAVLRSAGDCIDGGGVGWALTSANWSEVEGPVMPALFHCSFTATAAAIQQAVHIMAGRIEGVNSRPKTLTTRSAIARMIGAGGGEKGHQ